MSASILLTGGRTAVGTALVRLLHGQGVCGIAAGRQPIPTLPGLWRWQKLDLATAEPGCAAHIGTLLHVAPLWLLPPLLAPGVLPALRRVVAVGSTSITTKRTSSDPGERRLSLLLEQAELTATALAEQRRIPLTILRPTMLYGVLPDRQLSVLARFIARFGFMPLPGPGRGLRQPLHAGDVALAIRQAMVCPATFGRSYTLAGGETLSYRAMMERLFAAQELAPRIVPLPTWLMRLGFAGMRLVPRFQHLQRGMLERLERDQVFATDAAQQDFGFVARPFDARAVAWAGKRGCNENDDQSIG